jgi:alkanesulfonate monooxygenase SsuD/methylene tetrahydromethanopterin reductase-like flavin-dependent oxidoreductase (luciferase family)
MLCVGLLESLYPIEENATMQIGISLQNNQGIEDVQSIIHLARRAEELGFASVWVHDHVFNAAHVFHRIGRKPYYEPLTLLSYVAACTQRVGLGTSVGKYHRFSGMPFSPKPLQKPHIPILIGGNSRAAIRRAVRLGNGWHPFAISLETLRQGIHYLREHAQHSGRDMTEIPVSFSRPLAKAGERCQK